MSVLIKGVDMPAVCDECWALDDSGDYPMCRITQEQRGYTFRSRERRMDKCPLMEIPPHGRLIDVDYADDYAYDELEVANSYLTGWEAARAMQKIYRNAPTIIPADTVSRYFASADKEEHP